MPYRRLSPRSLFPTISRPSWVTLTAVAVTAAAGLTAGAATTGSGPARPLASGLPVIISLNPAGRAGPLIGGTLTAEPAGWQPRPAAAPAGGAAAAGRAGTAPHQPAGGRQAPDHRAAAQPAAGGHHAAGGHAAHGSKPGAGHRHARGHRAAHRHRGGKRAHREHAPPRHSYQMYDSVSPSSIPAHRPVAAYSTGRYYATPGQLRRLGQVMWIDITGKDYAASVLDVEPGDATPSQAASWVWHRLHASPHAVARLYTNRTEWPAVRAAVNRLPSRMRARVHWWIADPTGVPHIVAGASATQWYWGPHYDISKVQPGF